MKGLSLRDISWPKMAPDWLRDIYCPQCTLVGWGGWGGVGWGGVGNRTELTVNSACFEMHLCEHGYAHGSNTSIYIYSLGEPPHSKGKARGKVKQRKGKGWLKRKRE
jgi:hypothetical protein